MTSNFTLHPSNFNNPVIARVFWELNLIDQWGSGVPRLFKQVAEQGFSEPFIRELGLRVRFVFPLATSIQIQEPTQPQPESGVESKMAGQIISFLNEKNLSKSEIAKRLGKPRPTRYLNDLMAKLLRERYVEYTIPEKPNSRLQKYRLTEEGRQEIREGGEE